MVVWVLKLMERHPVLPLHQSRSLPFQHPNAICEESRFILQIPRFVNFITITVYKKSFSFSSDILCIFFTYFYVENNRFPHRINWQYPSAARIALPAFDWRGGAYPKYC